MANKKPSLALQRGTAIKMAHEGVFVDLNDKGIHKLFKSNIEPLEKVFNMKFYSHREYASLPTPDKQDYLKFVESVLTGERVKEMYTTAGDNYLQGIENVLHDEELYSDFDRVLDKIKDNKQLLKQFFNELPELSLFYKRSRKDGTSQSHQLDADEVDEQRADIYEVVDKWIEKVSA